MPIGWMSRYFGVKSRGESSFFPCSFSRSSYVVLLWCRWIRNSLSCCTICETICLSLSNMGTTSWALFTLHVSQQSRCHHHHHFSQLWYKSLREIFHADHFWENVYLVRYIPRFLSLFLSHHQNFAAIWDYSRFSEFSPKVLMLTTGAQMRDLHRAEFTMQVFLSQAISRMTER